MPDPQGGNLAILGLGTMLAGCLVLPMGLGWLVDHLLGTLPIFVLIGLVLGIAATARYAYTEVRKFFGS